MKKIPFITHLPLHLQIIKRAGTERATSSIIESGQKDTEASIAFFHGQHFSCLEGIKLLLVLLAYAITLKGINTLRG